LESDLVDGKFVYAIGGDISKMSFYKIDAENGNVIWRSNVTWDGTVLTWGAGNIYVPRVVARSQEQIVIEVIFQGTSEVNHFLCLDSSSGEKLWSIDVGADDGYNPFVFGPIIYEDLFLFAKADGYIYAVNLADGTTAWKTKVDTQNLFSFNSSFNNTVQPSSIQIDARNQRLFWSLNVKESAPASNYTGLLCSLSLSNGSVKWLKLLENENASFVGFAFGGINLAFNSETDKIFLTKNNGLWIFDASTSDLIQRQQFDHYILPPIAFGNETYVVGDLWLSAYS
jgi:outer membrane protein assembly factor BamB